MKKRDTYLTRLINNLKNIKSLAFIILFTIIIIAIGQFTDAVDKVIDFYDSRICTRITCNDTLRTVEIRVIPDKLAKYLNIRTIKKNLSPRITNLEIEFRYSEDLTPHWRKEIEETYEYTGDSLRVLINGYLIGFTKFIEPIYYNDRTAVSPELDRKVAAIIRNNKDELQSRILIFLRKLK